jgi:hypothetical protein
VTASQIATEHGAIRFRVRRGRWRATALIGVVLLGLTAAVPLDSHPAQSDPGLIAHEWGTFTTIAGTDGSSVQWTPVQLVIGEPELPGFVEHFRSGSYKGTLRGTVRMETPVIYFYTPNETKVSVHVSFKDGLITEWFPHASRFQPSTPLANDALYGPHEDGSVSWDSVLIAPSPNVKFPSESASNHYYTARNTSATPLMVPGPSINQSEANQHEKFLFYRGISTVELPLNATVQENGSIQFDNRAADPVPSLILFERRGDRLGYRILNSVRGSATLDIPSVSGTLDSLRGDVEDILVSQGLFRDEARAMIETWGNSWFEEGSRLFYIVPRAFLDSILPLSITPSPANLVRVFVGRIELITPATENSIKSALATHDGATLKKYGRFLYPILEILAAKQSDPEAANRMYEDLSAAYQ